MDLLKRLILSNRAWAEERLAVRSSYFKRLRLGQNPKILWLGCADSRVPAEQITCSQPGDLFVHRNIANLFHPEDPSALAVLEYAVTVLKVEEIIVCGHTGCGGIMASLRQPEEMPELSSVNKWLVPLRNLRKQNQGKIDTAGDLEEQTNALIELNVRSSIEQLSNTTLIRSNWEQDSPLRMSGWVYDTFSGNLKLLTTATKDGRDRDLQDFVSTESE